MTATALLGDERSVVVRTLEEDGDALGRLRGGRRVAELGRQVGDGRCIGRSHRPDAHDYSSSSRASVTAVAPRRPSSVIVSSASRSRVSQAACRRSPWR